jgi:hypothetical protein
MRSVIPKIAITILLLQFGIINHSKAQERYKGEPWILSYGVNLLIEDGNQFTRFVNNEKIIWNTSPYTFGIEKRVKNGFGLQACISSNLYPTKQKIKGLTLEVPQDVIALDFQTKFNFNSILKDSSKFDPYVGLGTGYFFAGNNGQLSANMCFGFNHWIGKSAYAIAMEGLYKIKLPTNSNNSKDNLLQINLMLIHIID